MKRETKVKGISFSIWFSLFFLLPFITFAQSADGTTPEVKPEPATTTSAAAVTPTQTSASTPGSAVPAPSVVTPSPKPKPQPQNVVSQSPEVLPMVVGTTSEKESTTETILFVVFGALAVVLGGYAAYAQSVKSKNQKEDENDKSRCFDIKSLMDKKLDEVTNLKAKLEEKLKDHGREKVREVLDGTDTGKLLVLIEAGEAEYNRLKGLFTECMAELDVARTHRLVILGPQCSGKTTLTRFLREQHPELPIIEEDELFTQLNGGEYPQDVEYKEKTIRPQLEEKIRQFNNMIFLTSYCNPVLLKELKDKGFKVVQLVLDHDEFQRRNERRMKEDGYADANMWAKEIFGFHDEVKSKGWADKAVDASQTVESVAKEILNLIN